MKKSKSGFPQKKINFVRVRVVEEPKICSSRYRHMINVFFALLQLFKELIIGPDI